MQGSGEPVAAGSRGRAGSPRHPEAPGAAGEIPCPARLPRLVPHLIRRRAPLPTESAPRPGRNRPRQAVLYRGAPIDQAVANDRRRTLDMKQTSARSTLVLAILLWSTSVAGATPRVAQDPASTPSGAELSRDNDSQPAPRLVTLADGRILRARARRGAAGWEIQRGTDEWLALPATSVTRVVLERDVLAEARRLEQQVAAAPRKEQPAKRAGYGDWLLRQGLVAEGLAQLDRVLAAQPDQPQALSVLESAADRVRPAVARDDGSAESSRLELLRFAANATPSLRELCVRELGANRDPELAALLSEQLLSHSPRLRATSALAMRRLYPAGELGVSQVRSLIQRSVLDGSEDVRLEAARALRDVKDAAVAAPAVRALSSANPRLRENAIQALGVMGYREAVEPMMTYLGNVTSAVQAGRSSAGASSYLFVGTQTAYVQDFDVEVAQFAAVADPQVNALIEGAVLDARVLGSYTLSFATESRLLRRSLGDLTGADPGGTNRDWLDWWTRNKSAWSAPLPPGRTSAEPAKR